MLFYIIQIVNDDIDKNWCLYYDGSTDGCNEKILHFIIAKPKPLILSSEIPMVDGKFTAEHHLIQIQAQMVIFIKLHPESIITMIMTDNENTMMALRAKLRVRYPDISAVGCDDHELSNHISEAYIYLCIV